MKKLIKGVYRKIYESSDQKAIQIIKNTGYSIISFDIFDTLIKRNISEPNKVFELLQNEYEKNFTSRINIKKLRIDSEKELTKINPYKENTLIEIYDNIKELNENERKWLIEKEISIEINLCQKNKVFFDLYQWCIRNNKKVYLISDMYLSKKIIEEILINAGYCNWKGLFVSSEIRKKKSKRELFEHVLQEINCKASDIIHVGDSLIGDYIAPKSLGINAILIPTNTGTYKKKENIGYDIIKSFINNNYNKPTDIYYTIGYSVLGPMLYGYVVWLRNQLKENQISKVFFLMREGEILKNAFDIINNFDIESKLLYTSRRAVTFPKVKDAEKLDDIIMLMHMNRGKLTIKRLLAVCMFSEEDIAKICNNVKINAVDFIETLTEEKKEHLYSIICNSVKSKAEIQCKNLELYLRQIGFTGKVAVSDVGWHGTIQEGLRYFSMAEIFGFYMGTKRKVGAKPITNIKGCFFDDKKNYLLQREIMFSVDLFEMLFLSTEGSTFAYDKINNRIYPQKGIVEHSQENIILIKTMQNAALKFVKDFNKSNLNEFDVFNEKDFLNSYINLVDPPKLKTIDLFSNFSFFNMEKQELIPHKGGLYYLVHPARFRNDFMNTGCKMFFLKKIFKIPLPYFEILCFIKRFDR